MAEELETASGVMSIATGDNPSAPPPPATTAGGSGTNAVSRSAQLRFALNILPTVLGTTFKHFTAGPPCPSWPLKLHLLIALIRQSTDTSMKAASKGHSDDQPMSKDVILRRVKAARAQTNSFMTMLKIDPAKVLITPWSLERASVDRAVLLTNKDKVMDDALDLEGSLAGEFIDWLHPDVPKRNGVVLYLHGGAYYMLSPQTHRMLTMTLSRVTGLRVLAIDYRLAPEHCFPAALHDALIAYTHLLKTFSPDNIFVMGDSAGGGLTASLLVYISKYGRQLGIPPPSGAVLFSPWLDLSSTSGPSWTDAEHDYLPKIKTVPPAEPYNPANMYAGAIPLDHEVMSPLHSGEALTGLGRILVQTGSIEALASDSLALHKYLSAPNRTSTTNNPTRYTIQVYAGMPHVFVSFPFLKETRMAFEYIGKFVAECYGGEAKDAESVVGKGCTWVGPKGEWENRLERESFTGSKMNKAVEAKL
ncbi:hypothetical protein HDU85_006715 [Gaertneriomyces sp. JEL0708]|nr:hypothetical protein HDU85_006715 [Gaertneriomyces sp. JEL0708]